MLEAQQRHNESIDLLSQRAEKVTNTVEKMRFDGGAIGHNLSSLGARVSELQDFVAQNEHEMREVADRLRKKHDEELRLLRESIVLEQEHMLAGIEAKLTHRLALESAAREQSMSVFVDCIDKKMGESSRHDGSLAKLKDRGEDSRFSIPDGVEVSTSSETPMALPQNVVPATFCGSQVMSIPSDQAVSSHDGVEVCASSETPMVSPQNVVPATSCGSQRLLIPSNQVPGLQTAIQPVVPQPGIQIVMSSEPPQSMLQRSMSSQCLPTVSSPAPGVPLQSVSRQSFPVARALPIPAQNPPQCLLFHNSRPSIQPCTPKACTPKAEAGIRPPQNGSPTVSTEKKH